jgi:hypothetical protein
MALFVLCGSTPILNLFALRVDLQCNIPSNRCYTCPVGNLGCACDGSSNCMLGERGGFSQSERLGTTLTFRAGLVCLAGVCTPNPSALTGELGQDCRPGPDANPPQPANLQCNLANVSRVTRPVDLSACSRASPTGLLRSRSVDLRRVHASYGRSAGLCLQYT